MSTSTPPIPPIDLPALATWSVPLVSRLCLELLQRISSPTDSAPSSSGVRSWQKDDDTPVSEIDLWLHQEIAGAVSRHKPEWPLISEEGDPASLSQKTLHHLPYWLIDPLDGTKDFLAGSSDYTINIALVSQGRPVFGVVGAPAHDWLCWGGRDFGWQTSHPSGLNPSQDSVPSANPPVPREWRLAVSRSHPSPPTEVLLSAFNKPWRSVPMGSSLKFLRVASQEVDFYPRGDSLSSWDCAAAQAVLEGAGGHVWTWEGQEMAYTDPSQPLPGFLAARPGVSWDQASQLFSRS